MEINRINIMSNLIASYEKILKTFQWAKTKNDFFHFVEIPVGVKFFYLPSENRVSVHKKFILFRKMRVNINQLNSSAGFSDERYRKLISCS